VPVNPPAKVTPAARVSTIARANRGRVALALAMVAGATAASDFALVGIALAAAAGLVLPSK
jgi:hypothetical protein